MKRIFISALLSTQLVFSAGIPVVDAVANSQSLAQNMKTIAEWAKEAQRWADTAIHYKSQLQAYENELLSKTGIRDTVGFLKDLDKLGDYAKMYGEDFLNLGGTNPNSSLGKESERLFEHYNIYDRCKSLEKEWEKTNCKNTLKREVDNIATVQSTSKAVDGSSKRLDELSKKVANSKDTKESQDLANAINIEIAQLQVANMKLDMMIKQNEAQKQAELEQHTQDFHQRLGKSVKLMK